MTIFIEDFTFEQVDDDDLHQKNVKYLNEKFNLDLKIILVSLKS